MRCMSEVCEWSAWVKCIRCISEAHEWDAWGTWIWNWLYYIQSSFEHVFYRKVSPGDRENSWVCRQIELKSHFWTIELPHYQYLLFIGIKLWLWSQLKFHVFLSYPSIEFRVTDCTAMSMCPIVFQISGHMSYWFMYFRTVCPIAFITSVHHCMIWWSILMLTKCEKMCISVGVVKSGLWCRV